MTTHLPFLYCILGSPLVKRADTDEILRFKRGESRQFLAYLLHCNGNVDSKTTCFTLHISDEMLGQVITDCNRLFGTGTIKREEKSIWLKRDSIATDITQFRELAQEADITPDIAARTALLRKTFALVRGDFLAGYADSSWAVDQQTVWQIEILEIGKTLSDLYEQQNLPRESCEVVRHLVTLLPKNEGIAILLRGYVNQLGTLQSPRKGSRAAWVAFTHQLTKRGLTVTLSETKEFDLFFASEWEGLEAYHSALQRLCILEGSFDAKFAAALCEISPAELSELSARALLIEHAGRFEMPQLMRQWIRNTLPAEQKSERQAAYHEWVRHTFTIETTLSDSSLLERQRYWRQNASHVEVALNALLDAPIPPPDARKGYWFDFCVCAARSFFPHRMPDTYYFLNEMLNDTSASYRLSALAGVGRLMIAMRQYENAAQHFHNMRNSWQEKAEQKNFRDYNFLHYTDSLHHGGKVEKAAELLEKYLPLIDPNESPRFLCDTLNAYAISLLALGRFEEAHTVSTRDIAQRRQIEAVPSASPFYQQGMALAGLKRYDEALRAFDEALELFKQDYVPHGEADCLQQMGKIHAERKEVNLGKRMIEEALRIYEQIPQMQSRAACLRSLGDVLKLKGDFKGAEAAYCEGLAFWENEVSEGRGGAGWVQRFRERLEQMHLSAGD